MLRCKLKFSENMSFSFLLVFVQILALKSEIELAELGVLGIRNTLDNMQPSAVTHPNGVQLRAILTDDLMRTALLAPPDSPSEPAAEDEDEFSRFFKISRFKFSRLPLPQLDAHVSDFALLLDALKGIPAPFPPPPIPGLFFGRMEGSTVGLARTGGLTGSCLALMTS